MSDLAAELRFLRKWHEDVKRGPVKGRSRPKKKKPTRRERLEQTRELVKESPKRDYDPGF